MSQKNLPLSLQNRLPEFIFWHPEVVRDVEEVRQGYEVVVPVSIDLDPCVLNDRRFGHRNLFRTSETCRLVKLRYPDHMVRSLLAVFLSMSPNALSAATACSVMSSPSAHVHHDLRVVMEVR